MFAIQKKRRKMPYTTKRRKKPSISLFRSRLTASDPGYDKDFLLPQFAGAWEVIKDVNHNEDTNVEDSKIIIRLRKRPSVIDSSFETDASLAKELSCPEWPTQLPQASTSNVPLEEQQEDIKSTTKEDDPSFTIETEKTTMDVCEDSKKDFSDTYLSEEQPMSLELEPSAGMDANSSSDTDKELRDLDFLSNATDLSFFDTQCQPGCPEAMDTQGDLHSSTALLL